MRGLPLSCSTAGGTSVGPGGPPTGVVGISHQIFAIASATLPPCRPATDGVPDTMMAMSAPAPIVTPVESDLPDLDIVPDVPWIVLVWNDPINLMSYVTFVFQSLFGYSLEKATSLMLDVHEKGRAVVSSGSKEKAELDVFRLHEHGLWATMQKDT